MPIKRMLSPVGGPAKYHDYEAGDCEAQGCVEVCPTCEHPWDVHAIIPEPRTPNTVYTGCTATSFGINVDDDLMCGCQVSRPEEVISGT